MTDAGIQERSASQTTKNRRWIFAPIAALVILAGVFYWWRNGGREVMLLALQPGFKVLQIDAVAKTMLITRTNETYLVSCSEACDLFTVGRTYSMRERGGALEFVKKQQTIQLPILREHIEFETAPGGHG